jgi:hypothetical protein
MPFFIVFQRASGRWVARGPFPDYASAEAARPLSEETGLTIPAEIVEAAHGIAAAHRVFRARGLPGYSALPPHTAQG